MQRKHLDTTLSIALASLLAACGGGGGGADGGSTSPGNNGGTVIPPPAAVVPVGSTLATPNYAADSVVGAMFARLNTYRQQCGFPAMSQNTILDKAAQAHADYMIANDAQVTDTEEQGKPGFTGVGPAERAAAQGWPSSLGVGTVNAGMWAMATLPQADYGRELADAWAVGAYHQIAVASASTLAGLGKAQRMFNGSPQVVAGLVFSSPQGTPANITTAGNVLTFPCEGVSGLAYRVVGEVPTPPGVSGAFGTPVTVLGNASDTVTISAGSMVSASGAVINLLVLNAATDPAKLVQKYQAVAYPAAPLEPSTAYSVTISGTVNGAPFTRSFRFTTGAKAG